MNPATRTRLLRIVLFATAGFLCLVLPFMFDLWPAGFRWAHPAEHPRIRAHDHRRLFRARRVPRPGGARSRAARHPDRLHDPLEPAARRGHDLRCVCARARDDSSGRRRPVAVRARRRAHLAASAVDSPRRVADASSASSPGPPDRRRWTGRVQNAGAGAAPSAPGREAAHGVGALRPSAGWHAIVDSAGTPLKSLSPLRCAVVLTPKASGGRASDRRMTSIPIDGSRRSTRQHLIDRLRFILLICAVVASGFAAREVLERDLPARRAVRHPSARHRAGDRRAASC